MANTGYRDVESILIEWMVREYIVYATSRRGSNRRSKTLTKRVGAEMVFAKNAEVKIGKWKRKLRPKSRECLVVQQIPKTLFWPHRLVCIYISRQAK